MDYIALPGFSTPFSPKLEDTLPGRRMVAARPRSRFCILFAHSVVSCLSASEWSHSNHDCFSNGQTLELDSGYLTWYRPSPQDPQVRSCFLSGEERRKR